MKIIYFLSNITYPPLEGAHEQTLNVIDELSKRCNQIDLFVFTKNKNDFNLKLFLDNHHNINIIKIIESPKSYSFRLFLYYFFYLFHESMFLKIFSVRDFNFLKQYDVIHIEGIPLLPFSLFLKKKNIVFSPIDAWSLRQKRLLGDEKNFFRFINFILSYYIEVKEFKNLNCIHLVSDEDVKYYNRFNLKNFISIPVSLPDFYFQRSAKNCNDNTLLLIGDIRVNYLYEGIYAFLKNNYSILKKIFPDLKVNVVSRVDPYGKLKDITINDNDITFLTWVDDLHELCSTATAIVLNDLNGTGQKNRTIMSMASGRPVFGTNFAFQGIGIKNNEQGFIYTSDQELNNHLIQILRDPIRANIIGSEGKKFAFSNFSMDSVSKKWLSLYSNIPNR